MFRTWFYRKLVNILDEELTRGQLKCLGRRGRMSNRVVSLICKLQMEDMKQVGDITRHIFTPDFMVGGWWCRIDFRCANYNHNIVLLCFQSIIQSNSTGWTPEGRKNELLPQYVQHNIAECDFLIGPALVGDHWICFVLDTRTGFAYVLDSSKPNWTLSRSRKLNDHQRVYTEAVDVFVSIVLLKFCKE